MEDFALGFAMQNRWLLSGNPVGTEASPRRGAPPASEPTKAVRGRFLDFIFRPGPCAWRNMGLGILAFVLSSNFTVAQNGVRRSDNFANLSRDADNARTSNRLGDAVLLYERALALNPQWQEGWWSLGMVDYVRDDYAPCAHAFQRLTALSPANGTAYAMLGLCEFELNEEVQALHHIELGESIGLPGDTQLRDVVRYHQGVLLQRSGKFEGARSVLEGLCADNISTSEIKLRLGMAALEMRNRNAPTRQATVQVILGIGEAACLAAHNQRVQARQSYAVLVQRHPTFPRIHYIYGRFLIDRANDPMAAIAEFEIEITANPSDAMAWLQIASAKYRIDSAGGVPYAQEAVKLVPGYPFGHYVLGLLLLDTGEYKKAIPELEIARRAFPRDVPQVYFALGDAYSHVGRKEEAARARATFAKLKTQLQSTGPMVRDAEVKGHTPE